MAPFGKNVTTDVEAGGCLYVLFNVIWLVLFGWEIALVHLTSAAILAITIIGGLSLTTAMTLFYTPILYMTAHRIRERGAGESLDWREPAPVEVGEEARIS